MTEKSKKQQKIHLKMSEKIKEKKRKKKNYAENQRSFFWAKLLITFRVLSNILFLQIFFVLFKNHVKSISYLFLLELSLH